MRLRASQRGRCSGSGPASWPTSSRTSVARRRQELLAALEPEQAADALEEMDPEELGALLRETPPEQAAELLASMEPDEAVDALRDLDEEDRERADGASWTASSATTLTELLEYREDTGRWLHDHQPGDGHRRRTGRRRPRSRLRAEARPQRRHRRRRRRRRRRALPRRRQRCSPWPSRTPTRRSESCSRNATR